MMSVAALVATIVVMYRKRVAKQESTPELATPNATGLGLEIPDSNYENDNMIVMESSLESINTSENIAYDRVVNA